MNFKIVGRTVGLVLYIEALLMAPSLLICLFDGEPHTALACLLAMAATAGAASLLFFPCRNCSQSFYAHEGFLTTGLSWVALSVMGSLPFLFSGQIPSFVDAFFETVSGFTTTGASILSNVEAMSRGLLYWRSFTHWVGGMGVLVFVLAVIPQTSGGSAMHLMRAESPGPSVDKLTARLGQTTRILYGLYLALTLVNILFLLLGGMPLFEAVCHALGTAGTGGFGVKNDSFMSYSPYLQNVTTIFMALFGVNFGVYYLILLRQVNHALADEELRLYLGIMAGSTLLIALNIHSRYQSWEAAFRYAAFQVSSVMTTTGYATADFDLWPNFSRTLLLCLMFLGACAGSTGGGMKVSRLLLMVKGLHRSMRKLLSPRSIQLVRVNKQPVSETVLANVNAYFSAYGLLLVASFLLLSLDDFSITTNLSAVISCFNNIGPGLETVGPACNYSSYSAFSKLVLSFDMLFGRLEIFPMLLLFRPQTWRRSA